MGVELLAGVGAYGKISGKDAEVFTDIKIIIYNGISKTFYYDQTLSYAHDQIPTPKIV